MPSSTRNLGKSSYPFVAECIPADLKKNRQWVGLKVVPVPNKKPRKIPLIATNSGREASSTDPSTWSTFDQAVAGLKRGAYVAVGYALADDFVGIDLDGDRWVTPEGTLTAEAQQIVQRCASYAEWSLSGKGIHLLLARSSVPDDRGKGTTFGHNKTRRGVEVYWGKRFFIVTGRKLENSPTTINENRPAL